MKDGGKDESQTGRREFYPNIHAVGERIGETVLQDYDRDER